MKKFLFALCGLCLGVPCMAADSNNIKMVTYFPVPYAAYGDLGVTGTCDVGLLGNCNMDAGSSLTVARDAAQGNKALNSGSLIVRRGKLDLNSSASAARVSGSRLSAGSGMGTGVLEFAHNLDVNTIAGSTIQSAQAQNVAYLNKLTMFGQDFPACDGTDNEISWQKLTVNGGEGVFLVCGARGAEVDVRTPCPSSCPSGYVRNPNVQYEEDGQCCVEKPTVYYFRCVQVTTNIGTNKYDSWEAAKDACESGADPGVEYYTSSTRTPMAYQRCGTTENEDYVNRKTRYSYQILQEVTKPIDPGLEPQPFKNVRYACTTSCANCSSGGLGKFFECSCAYGVDQVI